MLKIIPAIVLLLCLYGCSKGNVVIKPVDAAMNKKFLTGEGLDPRLFSTKDVFQYYKIEDYNDVPEEEIISKVNSFVEKKYHPENTELPETVTLLFYRENSFSNYGDGIYIAARDNEMGMIDDEDDNLIARSRITHVAGNKLKRYSVVYDKDKILSEFTDTIIINNHHL